MISHNSSCRGVVLTGLFIAISFILTHGLSYGQSKELIEAAKREGKVVGYTSLDSNTTAKLMSVFEKKYGIKGSFFRSSATTVMDKALVEYRASKVTYDAVFTNAGPMEVMKKEGLFTSYISPSSKSYDKNVVDKFFGPRYRSVIIGIVYNSQIIKKGDVPRSYEDLLDPKWKGKLITSDPTRHTTTTMWISSLHKVLGSKEKADEWVKKFAAQKPMLVRSLRPAIKSIGSGERPLGIAYLHHVFIYGKKGAPLDYVRGLPGYLGDGHYIGLSSKSPHPNAAKLFIDFFLSQESMEIMAKRGEFVSRKGVYPPLPGADQASKRFVQMVLLTKDQFAQRKNELKRIFKK